jgi:hypothetical protein
MEPRSARCPPRQLAAGRAPVCQRASAGPDTRPAGWRPEKVKLDKNGFEIENRVYNQKDFGRTLVLEKRTEIVAEKVTEFLAATGPYSKTIVFCEDIDHAERMRQALVNASPELCAKHRKYVMRITGDSDEGKAELDPFSDPEWRFPVIVTTCASRKRRCCQCRATVELRERCSSLAMLARARRAERFEPTWRDQRGHALISARTSGSIPGRPPLYRLRQVQYLRNPARCQAMTVAGLTMISVSL